jgi:hypothetical protein
MLMIEERYLTPDQAARELALTTPDLVYRLLRAGTIRGVKDDESGRWKIPYSEIELRRARVERKRCSASHVKRDSRSAVRERFAPLAGTPGASS